MRRRSALLTVLAIAVVGALCWENGATAPTGDAAPRQVTATLQGRIVDERHAPIAAARVTAFALENGTPIDRELARANTRTDGMFEIAVPPDTALFLLVAPMELAVGPRVATTRDGARPDTGNLRTDLLPTSLPARATIGEPRQLGDILLTAAANVVGTVRWSDGQPIARATVLALPRDGVTLDLGQGAAVQRHPDGRLSPAAVVHTNDDGAFTLPALPGASLDVVVNDIPATPIVGLLQQSVVPPQRLDFTLPRPIRVRATDGQDAVPHALVEVEAWHEVRADDNGIVALITQRPLRVRATHGAMRSPWLDVPMAAAGTTVDLVMTTAREALTIEFTSDFRVRNTVITWRGDGGTEGREHLVRDDTSGPFQLFLAPGRYRVTAGPGGGERNGYFLLPIEREVDLTNGPQALTLPAVFGGTFTLMATDSSGVWIGGTCQLRDSTGADVTERFRVHEGTQTREGLPGELLANGTNHFTRVLPPGDYELMCDFGDHGAQRQRVTIKAREVSEVRLRVP